MCNVLAGTSVFEFSASACILSGTAAFSLLACPMGTVKIILVRKESTIYIYQIRLCDRRIIRLENNKCHAKYEFKIVLSFIAARNN